MHINRRHNFHFVVVCVCDLDRETDFGNGAGFFTQSLNGMNTSCTADEIRLFSLELASDVN